MTKKIWWWFV